MDACTETSMRLKKTKNSRRWIFPTVVLVLVLFGDQLMSKTVFLTLCATESGQKIFSVTNNVEGLFTEGDAGLGCGGHCRLLLGKYKYRFVETHVSSPLPEFLATVPGNYRFYLAMKGAQECLEYERLRQEGPSFERAQEEGFGIPRAMCVASMKIITGANSRFAYKRVYQDKYVATLGIGRTDGIILDQMEKKIIARSVRFSRMNGWLAAVWGSMGGGERCGSGDDELLVSQVLHVSERGR